MNGFEKSWRDLKTTGRIRKTRKAETGKNLITPNPFIIAHWSWARIHRWAGLEIEELPHLKRWLGQIEARPACAKGAAVPHATTYHEPDENADEMATAIQSIVMK